MISLWNPVIPATIFEMVVSEIYREKDNPENNFAKVIGKNPKVSPYDYATANIRSICKYNSTFAGITFEDTDSMISSALNINKTKRKETESPIEKILKY